MLAGCLTQEASQKQKDSEIDWFATEFNLTRGDIANDDGGYFILFEPKCEESYTIDIAYSISGDEPFWILLNRNRDKYNEESGRCWEKGKWSCIVDSADSAAGKRVTVKNETLINDTGGSFGITASWRTVLLSEGSTAMILCGNTPKKVSLRFSTPVKIVDSGPTEARVYSYTTKNFDSGDLVVYYNGYPCYMINGSKYINISHNLFAFYDCYGLYYEFGMSSPQNSHSARYEGTKRTWSWMMVMQGEPGIWRFHATGETYCLVIVADVEIPDLPWKTSSFIGNNIDYLT